MDLKRWMRERIMESLASDFDLMAGFDRELRADNNHHLRTGVYGAAFGVFGPLDDSPVKGREEVWQTALGMFDRLCAWQGEDGLWTAHYPRFHTSEQNSYPWSVYSWLRTMQDFGEHFGRDRRPRVERMLRRAMLPRVKWAEQDLSGGIRHANNIFVHLALELWLAGEIFGEEPWTELAAETLETCFATQFEDGYWPDTQPHRGPATRYNEVTLLAASAYARMSGSATALKTVRRAADFRRWLSYPDGSAVETVDERNRYAPGGSETPAWCFAPFAATRPVAALFAARRGDSSRKPPGAPLGAILIDAWAATPEGDVAPAEAASGARRFPTIPAVAVRRGPWYACLSAATTRVRGGIWHHDLQNHLSLWHDALGLAVGGGNSLHAPLFSTFRFHGQYLADAGEAEERAGGAALTLRFGAVSAHLELAFENDGSAVLSARAEGDLPPDSEFAFHLPGLQGQTVHMPGGSEAPLADDRAFWSLVGSRWAAAGGGKAEGAGRFRAGALSVECDRPMRILWPCEPVNIYNPPARLPLNAAVLRVSAEISAGPAVFKLRVEGK